MRAVQSPMMRTAVCPYVRSEEHTSELQSHHDLVCRLLLEKKKHSNINVLADLVYYLYGSLLKRKENFLRAELTLSNHVIHLSASDSMTAQRRRPSSRFAP